VSAVQCFTLYSTVLFLCCSLISYTFVYLCGLQGVSTSPGTLQSFPWIVADVVIAGDTYKVYGNIYCDMHYATLGVFISLYFNYFGCDMAWPLQVVRVLFY
jgi:hypothetical protein